MTTYRTGNAIGSADPRDLYDNAQVIDQFANSDELTAEDRLGQVRKTIAGLNDAVDQAIANAGYVFIGDYAPGIEITARNQVIRADGEFWRLSASVDLPYTTTGAGMPEDGAFVSVGDAVLRQELAGDVADGQGAITVRGASIYVGTLNELKTIPAEIVPVGLSARITATGRAGAFRWDSSDHALNISKDPEEGVYVAPNSDPTGASGAWVREFSGEVIPTEFFGASLDRDDNDVPINAAIALWGKASCRLAGDIRVSSTINLSDDSDTAKSRPGRCLYINGLGRLKPVSGFSGSNVVYHHQTLAQAQVLSFAQNPEFVGVIDGSDAPSGVSGFRAHGTRGLVVSGEIKNMPHRGLNIERRADLDAEFTNDDHYANLIPSFNNLTIMYCGDWGIWNDTFSTALRCNQVYVTNNRGGVITGSSGQWQGGAIAYNGDPVDSGYGGLRFIRSNSATSSTLSNGAFNNIELDGNHHYNVWLGNCYNMEIVQPRLISREINGVMVPSTMVRFAGDGDGISFGNKVIQPYIRHTQQTNNPAITLFAFGSNANHNEVLGFYELTGGTSARQVALPGGSNNKVTQLGRGVVYTTSGSDALELNYASAHISGTSSISTTLSDVVFNTEVSDPLLRYDAGTGEYTVDDATGIYRVSGFVTADSPTSNRLVSLHLRLFDGTAYASNQIMSVGVVGDVGSVSVPFDFLVKCGRGAKMKLAAVASTGTPLLGGSTRSRISFERLV